MTDFRAKRPRRRWWSWGGAAIGLALLAFVLWRIDYRRFAEVVTNARIEYLALVPVAIALEQLVRAWKWRQILYPLQSVDTLRLFRAIMAGYLGNLLIPFGVSPLLRSWLVARLERLRMSAVLATVAIDRLIDGMVFAILVAVVLSLAVFPDPIPPATCGSASASQRPQAFCCSQRCSGFSLCTSGGSPMRRAGCSG